MHKENWEDGKKKKEVTETAELTTVTVWMLHSHADGNRNGARNSVKQGTRWGRMQA